MSKNKKEQNRVWREKLDSGGYTSSGVYYGRGAPLYGVICDKCDITTYVRASSYSAACHVLKDDREHRHSYGVRQSVQNASIEAHKQHAITHGVGV